MENQISILLVEDDADLASSLREQLARDDYKVAYAADGEAALGELNGGKFDIVILDLKIPKITGFEVLKHIKANIPATKVIVLTAYADLKNVEAVKQLGADDVIEKPYELGELFDAIEFVLKR